MSSRASIAGHPIHPMLVPLPIGLFVFSFVADLIARYGAADPWTSVAFYTMAGGVVGALLAAPFGLIDLLSLSRNTRARRIGMAHMAINLAIVVLYLFNLALRWQGAPVEGAPFLLSLVAILSLLVSGWLGGHMVYVHGVAVGPRSAPSYVERRQAQVPVRQDRRRMQMGGPLGQH
jgi:uncharacterized membrane protein